MRLGILLFASALTLAGCAAVLGFDDASEATAGDGGSSEPSDGSSSEAADAVDCGAPLGTSENCAACGHSCLGAACRNGACDAIPLKTGLTNPQGIALTEDSVFVALSFDDAILRIDKSGVSFSQITKSTAGGLPRAVATDADRVFWAASASEVRSCLLTGCAGAAMQYEATNPSLVLVDGDRVVWSEPESIQSRDKSDGGAPLTLAAGVVARAIESDGTYVYAADTMNQKIIRAPLAGGPTDTLTTTSKSPFGIAVTSTTLYYGESKGAVVSIPINGGAPTPFGAPTISATGLATDGTFLYWADEGDLDAQGMRKPDGCIRACPLATCATSTPIELACGQAGATSIAVDDQAVYWTNFGITDPTGTTFVMNAGSVMKVGKPPQPR